MLAHSFWGMSQTEVCRFCEATTKTYYLCYALEPMDPSNPLAWLTPQNIQFPEDVLILPHGAKPPSDGLVATYYPDGQLAFLGNYLEGSCDHSWVLTLEHGVEKGKAILVQGSGGSEDWETYSNGASERFDAWSDSSGPKSESYQVWVCDWLEAIVRRARAIRENHQKALETRNTIKQFGKKSLFKIIK